MRIGLLAGAVGLAMGLPALAAESRIKTDIREFNPDGTPVVPEFPLVTGKVGSINTLDFAGRFGSVSRGTAGGDGAPDRASMLSGFESLTELPATLVGQRDTVTWGGAASSVTGRPEFSANDAGWAVPDFGITSEAIGGNSTKKLRGFVSSGQGSPGNPSPFFGRFARYNLWRTNGATINTGTRFVFAPDTDDVVRAAHDTYITAITSLWTSEPTYTSAGFIIGRLLWGGENATTGIGLPTGAIPDFYTLGINPSAFLTGIFVPCVTPATYRNSNPFPGGAGNLVPIITGQWFRIIHETDGSGNLVHVLDKLDGNGEYVIYTDPAIVAAGRMDRLAFSGDDAVTNDAIYIDNINWSGVPFVLPTAPDRVCTGTFTDDQNWLFDGSLIGQGTEYVDFLSSRGEVLAVGDPRNNFATKAIYRDNWAPDDRYRKEIHRLLPAVVASGFGPFTLCQALRMNSGAGYATAQSIAPVSVADSVFLTRMMIGFATGPLSAGYDASVYIQINDQYNPIDAEATLDPFAPTGTPPAGGIPVVGTDIVDTGVNWVFNSNRNVCFTVQSNRNMDVTINAVNVHSGTAFASAVDRMDWESENNSGGSANPIVYDDIVLNCTVLPTVILPPLTLVYNDNLEWGFEGVTIDFHDDDNNPATPFRWSSPPGNIPIVSLNVDGSSKVLQMENVFQDTPAGLPNTDDFIEFGQANTGLPNVVASGTRGWVAKVSNLLTDGETSRSWIMTQASADPNVFNSVARLAYSSVSDTFWYAVMDASTPGDPNDITYEDSGTGLTGFGLGFNQWFSLSVHRSLSGKIHWRVGAIAHTSPANLPQVLAYTGGANNGQTVLVDGLSSTLNGLHKNMDRYFFSGSDEDTAPDGSILYIDNVRAWSLPCLGDTDNDGVVGFPDLNNVLSFFGTSSTLSTGVNLAGNVAPDTNNDNVPDDEDPGAGFLFNVNFGDLNAVLSGFGLPCTATN